MLGRRIVFITDLPLELEFAPVSRLVHLARCASADGFEIELIGCQGSPELVSEEFDITHLPIRSPGKSQAQVPFRREVRRSIKAADAVVVRGYWVAFFTLLLSAWYRVPVRILDFHGSTWREKKKYSLLSMMTRLMEANSFVWATHIVAVSRGVQKHVPKRSQVKCSVLGNGIDLESFSNTELVMSPALEQLGTLDSIQVGIVAHFGNWLELDTLNKAIQLMEAPVHVTLIGEGELLESASYLTNSYFSRLGKQSHSQVLSYLTRICDIAIVPYNASFAGSQRAGFFASRKTREYLAAGLPVVAPSIPGIDPLLEDGVNALLYEPGSAESLAGIISKLVADGELREELGRAGRDKVGTVTWGALYRSSSLPEIFL